MNVAVTTARPGTTEPRALERTSAKFLVFELVAAVLVFIALDALAGAVAGAPNVCRWCSQNAFDEGVRALIVRDDRLWAGVMTHRISLGFLPLVAILGTSIPALASARRRAALQDLVVILAVFIVATAVAGPVKTFASRERPGFVHGMLTEGSGHDWERFASFFSGDTAWAFAFAAVGATLAHLRGYRHARLVAVLGALGAIAVGLLRIRADMHWATDVIMGALVGTVVGVSIPALLHRRAET
jgi:membrane-associated phospholipid phosphatase